MTIRAVLWDFGGVITESPFVAFARYERENGLPDGLIRAINTRNPDSNAWALFERSEIGEDEFRRRFEAEADALGCRVDAAAVLGLIQGPVRPGMVRALEAVAKRYRTACLTNNMRAKPAGAGDARGAEIRRIMGLFDIVIESRTAGLRKPEPGFYRIACERLGVEPGECVFLDDLGINLKPARAMGMATIKVVSEGGALADLEAALGHSLG